MKQFAVLTNRRRFAFFLLAVLVSTISGATETENQGIRILPAPGKVRIDGKADDWNLSGGVFVCNDVETLRDKLGVWFHAMYDRDNLYFLARFLDETPLNNPGSSKGDYGFAGDCQERGPDRDAGPRRSDPGDRRDLHGGQLGAREPGAVSPQDPDPRSGLQEQVDPRQPAGAAGLRDAPHRGEPGAGQLDRPFQSETTGGEERKLLPASLLWGR